MEKLLKGESFIKGICHPHDLEMIKEAGIKWVRIDVPFPYEADKWGILSQDYLAFKSKCENFYQQGMRMMIVTPYPRSFINAGVDLDTTAGMDKVCAVCEFLATDFKHLQVAWQVTNELNLYHFRAPLSLEQAAVFITSGLAGIRKGNPEAINGYNTAGIREDSLSIKDDVMKLLEGFGFEDISLTGDAEKLISLIKPHHELCDYIGLDSYKGTWSDGEPEDIIADVDRAFELTGLPVMIQEFGFASAGEMFNLADVAEFITKVGYNSIDEMFANPGQLIEWMPDRLAERIKNSPQEDWVKNIMIMIPHLLKKWPGGSRKYPHTPQGQADFYDILLRLIINHPNICGAFIYSWKDSLQCYMCGEIDCPCETAWGLTFSDETPKPALDVVKKHFS